jgi:hypothetical protein
MKKRWRSNPDGYRKKTDGEKEEGKANQFQKHIAFAPGSA